MVSTRAAAMLQALQAPSPVQRPSRALRPWMVRCRSPIRLSSPCTEQSQSLRFA